MGFVRQLTGTTRKDAARALPPPIEPVQERQPTQQQTLDADEEERRRRARLFAGIRTSPLGIAEGERGQTGRSQLLGV